MIGRQIADSISAAMKVLWKKNPTFLRRVLHELHRIYIQKQQYKGGTKLLITERIS